MNTNRLFLTAGSALLVFGMGCSGGNGIDGTTMQGVGDAAPAATVVEPDAADATDAGIAIQAEAAALAPEAAVGDALADAAPHAVDADASPKRAPDAGSPARVFDLTQCRPYVNDGMTRTYVSPANTDDGACLQTSDGGSYVCPREVIDADCAGTTIGDVSCSLLFPSAPPMQQVSDLIYSCTNL